MPNEPRPKKLFEWSEDEIIQVGPKKQIRVGLCDGEPTISQLALIKEEWVPIKMIILPNDKEIYQKILDKLTEVGSKCHQM